MAMYLLKIFDDKDMCVKIMHIYILDDKIHGCTYDRYSYCT